jgi:hypothetical protein
MVQVRTEVGVDGEWIETYFTRDQRGQLIQFVYSGPDKKELQERTYGEGPDYLEYEGARGEEIRITRGM